MIDTSGLSLRTRHHIYKRLRYLDIKFAIPNGSYIIVNDPVRTFGVETFLAMKVAKWPDIYGFRFFRWPETSEMASYCVLHDIEYRGQSSEVQIPLDLYPRGYGSRPTIDTASPEALEAAKAGI